MHDAPEPSVTLIITGPGLWEKRASDAEAMRMAIYTQMADARHADRCATCAFRTGTPANGSSLVVHCIDSSFMSEGTFGCHEVPKGTERECAGFAAIKHSFMPTVHRPNPTRTRDHTEAEQST